MDTNLVRVTQNRTNHTEAVTSRYELLMLPSRWWKVGGKNS